MILWTKSMIKLLLLIYPCLLFAQDNTPRDKSFEDASIFSYSLLTQYKRLNVSFTHDRIPNWDERNWEQNFLNLRYKLSKSWQFGIGHGQQRGDRSNSDWKNIQGVWQWKDTTHRVENLSDVLINYKALWRSVIFEWRNTFRYNHHFDTKRFITRMSFNYYPMKIANKQMNLILSLEAHAPLNENETEERWAYLMWLVHLNEHLLIGPKYVYFRRDWQSLKEFEDQTFTEYDNFEELSMFGIQLINKF